MAVVGDVAGGDVGRADWRSSDLWQALAAMRIEPEGAKLTFEARLARENGWSRRFADAVVEEYRRFLYLAATSEEQVTPSDEVDQAWHLHLAYTRHYWVVLCGEILKRPLHHGPTAGGEAEADRYWRQYEETLERYRRTFGEEPPLAIWPAPQERFTGRQMRVDVSRYWLVPRSLPGRGALIAGSALIAACSMLTAAAERENGGGPAVVAILIIGLSVMIGLGFLLQSQAERSRKNDGSCGGGGTVGVESDGGDGSGCGGGCGGCGG